LIAAMAAVYAVKARAAPNIAVIKYWGKRDVALNLPINSSLSATLHHDDLRSETEVQASAAFEGDSMELNGKQEPIVEDSRMHTVLRLLRARACDAVVDGTAVAAAEWRGMGLRIVSHNNFPTAAGLASSASGFCCLVTAVATLFHVEGDITAIARQGSGSACRSLFGGFAKWNMGSAEDGSDSIAEAVADERHWPDLEVLILVACADQKEVSSTAGMQTTVATCPGVEARIAAVPPRMAAMEAAVLARDYDAFADLTMLDSDHFHELCHTTEPPIRYMNAVSHNVVRLVRAFNAAPEAQGRRRAAYTFDAGPNAVIYLPRAHVADFLSAVRAFFSTVDRGTWPDFEAKEVDSAGFAEAGVQVMPRSLQRVIHTHIGPAPTCTPVHSV